MRDLTAHGTPADQDIWQLSSSDALNICTPSVVLMASFLFRSVPPMARLSRMRLLGPSHLRSLAESAALSHRQAQRLRALRGPFLRIYNHGDRFASVYGAYLYWCHVKRLLLVSFFVSLDREARPNSHSRVLCDLSSWKPETIEALVQPVFDLSCPREGQTTCSLPYRGCAVL